MQNTDIWNVIYTRSRYEKKILKILESKGLDVYLPLISKKRKWSDRTKIIEVPLFPGYLFIKPTFQNYYDIINIDGVVRFLKYEEKIATITLQQMQLIRILVQHHQMVAIDTFSPQPGDKVIIKSGPFSNFTGIFNGSNNKKRIYLYLESINKSIILNLENTIIEKIFEEA